MTSADAIKGGGRGKIQTSPQSRKIKREEIIAKGIIWFLAGLTIAILAWIVGYLMVKGLRYDNHPPYEVTGQVETAIPLEGTGDEVVFIINGKIRTEDLPVAGLRKLYNKVRTENWGFYSQQDLKAAPFICEQDGGFSDRVKEFLLDGADLEDYRRNVNKVRTWDEMIEKIRVTPGGVGFIPAFRAMDLPKGVKILGVRRISLGVNSSVLQIQDGKMLREVSQEQLDSLISGQLGNWKEIGGTDLPVTLIRWESGDIRGSLNLQNKAAVADVITARSEQEFYELLRSTPGAAAQTNHASLAEAGLDFIPVLRHETGWNLTWHFIFEAPARSGQWGGISYIIINTFFLILFTILFSTPVGIMAAIFLVEYANQGRLMRMLRMGTETLAGIPSIVFGLFGFIFFVQICGFGIGFISSTLTITLMVLPTIIRTSEEALKSVPSSFREGSLALGATKLQTILKVVLPAASPGILTGIILAIGRTVGETAVLIYTLGSNYDLVTGPTSSARVLSLHLYMLFSEALSFDRTFATGAVLVIVVLLTNLLTTRVIKQVNKNTGNK